MVDTGCTGRPGQLPAGPSVHRGASDSGSVETLAAPSHSHPPWHGAARHGGCSSVGRAPGCGPGGGGFEPHHSPERAGPVRVRHGSAASRWCSGSTALIVLPWQLTWSTPREALRSPWSGAGLRWCEKLHGKEDSVQAERLQNGAQSEVVSVNRYRGVTGAHLPSHNSHRQGRHMTARAEAMGSIPSLVGPRLYADVAQ